MLARAPVLAGILFSQRALSISVGLASLSFDQVLHTVDWAPDDDESEALFRAADKALYAAKHAGRNRVHSVISSPGLNAPGVNLIRGASPLGLPNTRTKF